MAGAIWVCFSFLVLTCFFSFCCFTFVLSCLAVGFLSNLSRISHKMDELKEQTLKSTYIQSSGSNMIKCQRQSLSFRFLFVFDCWTFLDTYIILILILVLRYTPFLLVLDGTCVWPNFVDTGATSPYYANTFGDMNWVVCTKSSTSCLAYQRVDDKIKLMRCHLK